MEKIKTENKKVLDLKYYKLLLKYLCVEQILKKNDFYCNHEKSKDISLLYTIYDLSETEIGFFYLSDDIINFIEQIIDKIRWRITDKRLLCIVNDIIVKLNIIKNSTQEEKEFIQKIYLQENFKIRSGIDNYYEEALFQTDNNLIELAKYNLCFQQYDYLFYQNSQRENFGEIIKNGHCYDFVFSLNYLIDYQIKDIFLLNRKKIYFNTLTDIEKYNKNMKSMIKYTKKHLNKIYEENGYGI